MQKKVLSEIDLYYGKVDMPKGFEIDRKKIKNDILNTYIREHIGVEYNINLVNKDMWGNTYKPQETTIPLLNIDPVDLRNSPDYTLLYGVKVKDCMVRIHYEDNRRKGRSWDMLNTYMRDHFNVKYERVLINKSTWGNIYKPNEVSIPLLNIDPVDLRNSPDFTFLYGVKVSNCNVRIHYEDNRRKGRSWDIKLENNKFIMFPSTCMYYITNTQRDSLNFIQTITYEYI